MVASFKTVKPEHTEEELIKANILGWCVELVGNLLVGLENAAHGRGSIGDSCKLSSWSRTTLWTAPKLVADSRAGTRSWVSGSRDNG